MTNENDPRLKGLIGKTIDWVHLSNSHGENLQLSFTDGTRLDVCSTYGLLDKTVKYERDDIYVSINGEKV